MNSKECLIKSVGKLKQDIIVKLTQFVQDYGEDISDYDRNEFGLDYEEENGFTVYKVLNLFDNLGCYFFKQNVVSDDSLYNINDDDSLNCLYNSATHVAYQCLYIVKDKDNNEQLRYYCFTNCGLLWDDYESEPEHGNVNTLPLIDLYYLLQAIDINF